METKTPAAAIASAPAVTSATVTEQKTAKKKAVTVPATPPVQKEPSVTVDFKRCKEDVTGKATLPENTAFKVNDKKTLLVHGLLVSAINGIIGTEKLDKPLIISRKSILNAFCIANKVTPLNCKKENKTENATVSTYGVVPVFEDTFPSGDLNTYKLFGFLRNPILTSKNWVAVKYGTYLVIMNPIQYALFDAGKLLEDVEVKLIGEVKKSV